MARLPQPGADDGIWGEVLNNYLSQAHNADGSLKAAAVAASVTKNNIGLADVDNTSDVAKPISMATQAALDDRLVWASATDANTPRPPSAQRVIWIGGTVEPVNIQVGDIWFKE